MDYRPQILNALKSSSSQEPMCIDVLQVLLGVGKATIQPSLDAMYNQVPASINRALITREGIEKAYYWPTGVVVSFKGDSAGAKDHVRTWSISSKRPALPRRTDNKKPSPAVAQKGEEMKTEKKVSNVDVVTFVNAKPGVTNQEVLDHFAGEDQTKRKAVGVMICNCLTSNYLKRQEDKSLVVGDNEIWLAQHDLLPKKESNPSSMAAAQHESAGKPPAQSKKPEGVDTAGGPGGAMENDPKAGNQSEEPAAQPSSLVDLHLKMHHPEAVAGIEIPAFLRKRDETASAVTLSDPEISYEEIQAQKLVDKPAQFRLAVSSDRTLTIFGKTLQPIELSPEETEELLDFMDGISMLFPAPTSPLAL